MIPFNKPHLTGRELEYINDAVRSGKISGNGKYTKLCHEKFQKDFGFKKCLLTNSCTDALEMAAILTGIESGDEVIIPSYTFVSTANAFILRGAKVIFADSRLDHPGIDEYSIERLITPKTKVIVPVHYGGVSCNMDVIMDIALRHNLFVVEDAAQAIDSFYINGNNEKVPLGSIGHLATFSFHETKNIVSGEGGMLVVNHPAFFKRSEIIWEKGTNRSAFFRGEINKYGWVDIGSSFLPSEIIAAFLFAQLENISIIQEKRLLLWQRYYLGLEDWANKHEVRLPYLPEFSTNNAHMFYLIFKSSEHRSLVIKQLKENGVMAVFHYLSLHSSKFFYDYHDGRNLFNSDFYSDTLLRLPMYFSLNENDVDYIINVLNKITFDAV